MTDRQSIVKIELSNLKRAIANLAGHPDFYLKDLRLADALGRDHRLVSYVVSYLYKDHQYGLIVKAIEEHEPPSILIPGTLGAYLFGCLLPTYGEGSRECSPLCIGSVPYPPTIKGGKICKDRCNKQVWVLRRYKNWASYTKVNNSDSRQAIIYVDTNFSGFSTHDIQNFYHRGLKTAVVMDTTDDGHHVVYNECQLSQLPLQNGQTPVAVPVTGTDTGDDSNRTAIITLSVVLVIIILVFVIWAILYY